MYAFPSIGKVVCIHFGSSVRNYNNNYTFISWQMSLYTELHDISTNTGWRIDSGHNFFYVTSETVKNK